jgi:hypothetical protein
MYNEGGVYRMAPPSLRPGYGMRRMVKLTRIFGGTMSQRLEKALAPDFSLADTQGNMLCLSDYRNKKHVVLVFTRGFA